MRLHALADAALLNLKDERITPTVPAKNPVQLGRVAAPSVSPGGLLLLGLAVALAWALSSASPPPRGGTLRG